MREPDVAILAAVLRREPRAWRDLVRRHDARLREAVQEIAGSEDPLPDADVDDVLGDFWLMLLEDDLRRLRGFTGDDLEGWMSMLAGQLAINRARKLAR